MGCRHYFVVDRLEDSVDEDGSRSSLRAHEHENFLLVSQLHVAIQTPWSRCPSRWTLWTNRSVVQSQRVSPFYHDLHLHLSLFCLCFRFPLNVQQTKRVSISWALKRDVFSFTTGLPVLSWFGLGFGLVGWLLLVDQLLNPILSRKSLEAVEVIQRLFRKWFLQFPSEQLSGYNNLGV